MDEDDRLAGRFEANRPRLRAMAYRMLGSLSDADDAVQEAWIHAAGASVTAVDNPEGWFTTIVARVCLITEQSEPGQRGMAVPTFDGPAADPLPAWPGLRRQRSPSSVSRRCCGVSCGCRR